MVTVRICIEDWQHMRTHVKVGVSAFLLATFGVVVGAPITSIASSSKSLTLSSFAISTISESTDWCELQLRGLRVFPSPNGNPNPNS